MLELYQQESSTFILLKNPHETNNIAKMSYTPFTPTKLVQLDCVLYAKICLFSCHLMFSYTGLELCTYCVVKHGLESASMWCQRISF